MRPEDIIRREYGGGLNFMTPNVVECGTIGEHFVFELSWGEAIDRPLGSPRRPGLWGVTIVEHYQGLTLRRTDVSDVFPTQALARKYIAELRAEHPERKLGVG